MDNKLNDFTNHMEFIGYMIESIPEEVDTVLAKHEKYGPTFVINHGGPTAFRSFYNVNSNGVKKKTQFLELVNELNKSTSISTFTAYDESLLITALYIGPYNKKEFGTFLDVWHEDNYKVYEQEKIDLFLE